ncbi:uncharacterized protein Aud_002666 [Aspergillus udagawae]|uniref:Uncharacterized protein n=1 Tax=Aspergillus udagawae TaxID=91492 RepID=A0A8E0QL08_9EURO|nr:uncharacterized protein Aud_002666 [Aspergillus udagawae]GIC86298.1 hypothetical protein Aud_002666 [Aspergillus udagawae]
MSTTTSPRDSDTLAPDVTAATNLGQGLSYELVSKPKFQAYRIVRPGSQADSVYYIETHETLSKNKFDLLLHKGDSKDGEVLGVVKMHRRGFTIGLGDPAREIEGKPMVWEKLERPEKHGHKVYHFDFGTGAQRMTYTYRKSYGVLGRLKSMELRAGGVDKEDGLLLAKWVGSSSWMMKAGSLFIANTAKSRQDRNAHLDEDTNKWEIMVCLTAFAIIESRYRGSNA